MMHGPLGMMVALVAVFASSLVFLLMALGTGARERKRRELARRVAIRPRAEEEATAGDRLALRALPLRLVAAGERAAEAAGFADALVLKLEAAGWSLRAGELVAGSALAALAGALVGAALLQDLFFVMLSAAAGASVPYVLLKIATARRTDKLHGQLSNILTVLASSLRAGHSFLQALDTVAGEVDEPAAGEFARVVSEIRLGRPIDEALLAVAERVGSEDFKWAVLAVNIQREVGGNLAEVLDGVADTIRERERIRRQVKVLSAEGRLSMHVLTGLPVLVGLYIALVNPSYLRLLFSTGMGIVMVVAAGAMLGLGVFWMRKVVRIDV